MYTDLLLKFLSHLGISVDEVKKCESIERFALTVGVQIGCLKSVSEGDFNDLIGKFGHALELAIGTDEDHPMVEAKTGSPNPSFTDFLNTISSLPDKMEFRISMQIEKSVILENLGIDQNKFHGLFYLFFSNLDKLLKAPLPDLDRQLFTDLHVLTLIIVSDVDILCCGALLTIIGDSRISQYKNILSGPSEGTIQTIDYFHNIASEYLNWVDFYLERLTPIHFACDIVEGNQNLASVLASKTLDLLIVYSANRSIIEEQQMRAFYASSEQTTELMTSEIYLTLEQWKEIIQIVAWIETSQKADKLIIFQNTVAREITGDDPKRNFKDYIERLPHLFKEACWNYRVYLDGKITKNFEKVEDANEKVASISGKVSDAIDSLTKGFVDTLLASVGVVILALIASLAENKIQGTIFKVGMWIYAIYLLIFQVIYRIGHLFYGTRLSIDEGEQQLEPYKTALGSDKVDELTTFLTKRKRYFYIIFIVTTVLFLLVIAGIALSGIYLPTALSNIISPTFTPISTPIIIVTPTP